MYNAVDGMMAADENDSPSTMDKRNVGPNAGAPWTLLAQSSDLKFLVWQQQCAVTGGAVGGLKYAFHVNVVNQDAETIIPLALQSKGATIGDFAHSTTFYKGDPGFYALLGVPNPASTAIMLCKSSTFLSATSICPLADNILKFRILFPFESWS